MTFWDENVLKKSHYEINVFLQNMLAIIVGTPRFFMTKNISEVHFNSFISMKG